MTSSPCVRPTLTRNARWGIHRFSSKSKLSKMSSRKLTRGRAWTVVVPATVLGLFSIELGAITRPIPEIVNATAFAHVDGQRLEMLVWVSLADSKEVQFRIRGDAC